MFLGALEKAVADGDLTLTKTKGTTDKIYLVTPEIKSPGVTPEIKSPAAKPTRAAAREKARRVQEVIRTLPRQNMRSTKKEILNTKVMRAHENDGVPIYKVKTRQQVKENLWRAVEKNSE